MTERFRAMMLHTGVSYRDATAIDLSHKISPLRLPANPCNLATLMAPTKEANTSIRDEQVKMQLVLDEIARRCSSDSENPVLRTIGTKLQNGTDRLQGNCLSGGHTNYSYKVFLQKDPEVAIFAKIAFPYALWNPDRNQTYDLARTENEFAAMKQFSDLLPNAPVATPYFCATIEADCEMKLIVTEWARADKDFAQQFVKGRIDSRVIAKLAEAFATLNLTESFDRDFNASVRPYVKSMFPQFVTMFEGIVDRADTPDRCISLCKEMGVTVFQAIMDEADAAFHSQEVFVHGDGHCFNILVADHDGPCAGVDETDAAAYICDWEMAYTGPRGSDTGRFLSWPLACLMCHAVRGDREKVLEVRRSIDLFWKAYSQILTDHGKDDAYVGQVFRSTLGSAGLMLFPVFYMNKAFLDCLPVDDLSRSLVSKCHGYIGCIGLRLMELGYAQNTKNWDLPRLWEEFDGLLQNESETLAQEWEEIERPCSRISDSLVSTTLDSMRSSFSAAWRRSSLLPPSPLPPELLSSRSSVL